MSILKELEGLKIEHYCCPDPYYSCLQAPDPQRPNHIPSTDPDDCNCGANEHNAKVDAVIAKLRAYGFNPLQDSE